MSCDQTYWVIVALPLVICIATTCFIYKALISLQRVSEFYRRGYIAALRVLHEDVRLSENETRALLGEKFKQMDDEQCSSLNG